MRIRHLAARGLIGLALISAAVEAGAQDRLFIDGSEIGALGRFGETIGAANGLDGTLAGGGRFRVPDTSNGETDVIDLRTGSRRPLPSGANVAAVDPARPLLILWLPGTGGAGTVDIAAYDIVTGVVETILTRACEWGVRPLPPVVYAYDAQLVVAQRCSAPEVVEDLVAVDLATHPRQIRQVPIAFGVALGASSLAVSSDGQRLFTRTPTGFLTERIEGYDLVSGTQLGVGSPLIDGELRWDDALDALVVVAPGGFFDGNTVKVLGRSMEHVAAARLFSASCSPRIQVSAHTGRIYATTHGGVVPTVVEVFAGAPLQSAGRAVVSPLGRFSCRGAVVRTAPGAPRSLQATVNGRDVIVDWTNVGGASGFLLDVGLAAGRTDLSISLGPNSQAAFANVPPGTYYLRVRGGNEFGGGRASAEIQVVVP